MLTAPKEVGFLMFFNTQHGSIVNVLFEKLYSVKAIFHSSNLKLKMLHLSSFILSNIPCRDDMFRVVVNKLKQLLKVARKTTNL